MQQRVIPAIASAALLLLATLGACGEPGPAAVVHTRAGPLRVVVEVARDDETRQRGLMWRKELADGRGMIFVFPADADHHFWMKNTFIPLDLLFIAADGRIVGIHPNAKPQSLAQISVGTPSRYVLEVPGGYAARSSIAVGDRVELVGVGAP
jgi:uncharacterized membrane protein (UPF0127 family)